MKLVFACKQVTGLCEEQSATQTRASKAEKQGTAGKCPAQLSHYKLPLVSMSPRLVTSTKKLECNYQLLLCSQSQAETCFKMVTITNQQALMRSMLGSSQHKQSSFRLLNIVSKLHRYQEWCTSLIPVAGW